MDWCADFETTTDPMDCRVWAWGALPVGDTADFRHGVTIQSFCGFCATQDVRCVWFHNLAFDGKFIISHLLRNGYEHTTDSRPFSGEFSTLISSKGQFYQITVNFNGHVVRFCDSLKLFPMRIADVARAFGLEVTKGELDYDRWRAPGHELTEAELDYLRRDVEIASLALGYNYDAGMKRLTIGSNAFADYKKRLGKYRFRKLFPVLDKDVDAFVRKAYRGGYTYCEPRFAGKDVSGISVDYTSMYPSQMLAHPYPIGEPKSFDGRYAPDVVYPLFVQRLTCAFHLRPNGLPCIQLRGCGRFGNHEYVRASAEPVQITLTSPDLAMFERMYEIDVLSWDGGYKFQQASGLFDDYINHWAEIKNNSEGGARQLAKLMLNNLYGKFATNPDHTQKVPVLDPSGTVRYILGEQDEGEGVYIPVGAFATAYARCELLDAILKNRERFVYCDTDSMHLVGDEDPEGIPIGNTLGHWKIEGHFSRARHLRAKTYIWDLNGKTSVTCAGMPENVKAMCNFDNFNFGLSNVDPVTGQVYEGFGKLLPHDVPGGVVLVPSPYVLQA